MNPCWVDDEAQQDFSLTAEDAEYTLNQNDETNF